MYISYAWPNTFQNLYCRMPPPTVTQGRRSSRIQERASTQRPKRDRAPSRTANTNNTVSGVQASVTPGNDAIETVGQSITSSLPNVQNVCTLPNPNNVLDTVNSLAASVLAMQQQMHNMTNLMQNSLMSPQGPNQTQPMNSSNCIQAAGQPEMIRPQGQNMTPTDLPNILCNSPVLVNACNSGSDINIHTGNDDNNYITSMQHALPLGSMVSDQSKNKIWANDYVELGSLLPKIESKSRSKPLVVENLGTFGKSPQLAVEDNSKEIKSMDQWVSAFTIFMAIYCEKFKDAAPALLKYMNIVRDIAKRKGDWLEYDIEFRKTKCQFKVSWANIHHELWLLNMLKEKHDIYKTDVHQTPVNSYINNNLVPMVPIGYCRRFHEGSACQLPCRYNHKCYKCNRLHPANRCWQQVNAGTCYQSYNVPRSNYFRPPREQPRARSFQTNFRFPRPPIRYPNSIPVSRR